MKANCNSILLPWTKTAKNVSKQVKIKFSPSACKVILESETIFITFSTCI